MLSNRSAPLRSAKQCNASHSKAMQCNATAYSQQHLVTRIHVCRFAWNCAQAGFHKIAPVETMQISRTVGLHDSHKAKLSINADLCRIVQLEALQACTDSDVVQMCVRQAAEDLWKPSKLIFPA